MDLFFLTKKRKVEKGKVLFLTTAILLLSSISFQLGPRYRDSVSAKLIGIGYRASIALIRSPECLPY